MLAAFLDSVDGSLVMLRAIVVGVAYLLPYLVVLGIPVGGVYVWRRRNSDRRNATTDEESTDDKSDENND